ncbi:MAG: hypothetical protein JWO11_4245 [Nocardioides sp.]|nr:hypothetical protein [Nocardioides sp.]
MCPPLPVARTRYPCLEGLCRVIKKLILTALAGLVGLGLTAVPAAAAQQDPYVASVATHCASDGVRAVRLGNSFVTQVEIRANGNTRPKGTVEVTYTRIAGGFSATRTVKYVGHAVDVKSPVLTRLGKYRVRTAFTPADGSRFQSCSGSFVLGVRNGVAPNDDGPDPAAGPDGNGILPNTGGPDLFWLILALALVGGGAALVFVDRRRRRTPTSARLVLE